MNIFSQSATISGIVEGSDGLPISFANVLLYELEADSAFTGVTTDEDGSFQISNLQAGKFKISFSFVGYETVDQIVEVVSEKKLGIIILNESTEFLDEAIVTAKRPTIQKTAGKLVFNVENTSVSVGSTFDLLKKTPGVVVIGESIKIKFTTPTIYINGKRVYLSSSEVISLLQNTDASTIKSIEVITSPSAKYDAEAGKVLNIITSRAISIGYKGNVNGRYEQAEFPKYNFGTSHFYKNKWINFYGSYSFSPRFEIKEDDNHIRYFEPDGSTNSIWETNFTRKTRSKAHQANIIADFKLSEKQTLGLTATIFISPNISYKNNGIAEIFNSQHELDSIFKTHSVLENDTDNLSYGLNYTLDLNDEGSKITAAVNYIDYDKDQTQNVGTTYRLPNGVFLRNNSFFTNARQRSNIITGQADLITALFGGTIEAGIKYSDTDTESGLDFFDIENRIQTFNKDLSDDFNYKENIYGEYLSFAKEWDSWNFEAGMRGEYTHIDAISLSLGKINTQKYFEFFPSASLNHAINDNNNVGASYKRSIHRPRYQSLNPFRYFITENNFNGGNPELVPAIESTFTLSYNYKNKLFIEAYYQDIENNLDILTFQDNENRIIRNIDSNLINEFQYSLDIMYYDNLLPWWLVQLTTSTFYLENKFFSVESDENTYSNSTFGFYGYIYNGVTLSKKSNLSSDITATYISNLISGSYKYENQFNLSISFRKTFWDNRASINIGVDDIFDTNNIPLNSKYYNQDNGYFAKSESRLFRVGFRYNFGNARLHDNNKNLNTEEKDRLN